MSSAEPVVTTITTNTDTRAYVPGPAQCVIDVGGGATVTLFAYTQALGKGAAIIDSRTNAAYTTSADDVFAWAGGCMNITTAGIVDTVTVVLTPIKNQNIPQ